MNKESKAWLKMLAGDECWTNAFGDRFGERVCVGIDESGEYLWHNGKKFVPTDREVSELHKDHLYNEYGTTDMDKIMQIEGFGDLVDKKKRR